jgi:hypothetical protein
MGERPAFVAFAAKAVLVKVLNIHNRKSKGLQPRSLGRSYPQPFTPDRAATNFGR